MSLATRRSKINAIAQLARPVFSSNKSYNPKTRKLYSRVTRAYHVTSLNSNTDYQVKWTRRGDVITAEMWTYSGELHISSYSKVITDLMKAAIKAEFLAQALTISFCDSFDKAVKLLNFGGRLLKIRNRGCGVVWAVVR